MIIPKDKKPSAILLRNWKPGKFWISTENKAFISESRQQQQVYLLIIWHSLLCQVTIF
jgi:hypothetical protein